MPSIDKRLTLLLHVRIARKAGRKALTMPKSTVTKGALRAKTQQRKKQFTTMLEVAEAFGFPQDDLVKIVHQAFVQMMNEEGCLCLPLTLHQSVIVRP